MMCLSPYVVSHYLIRLVMFRIPREGSLSRIYLLDSVAPEKKKDMSSTDARWYTLHPTYKAIKFQIQSIKQLVITPTEKTRAIRLRREANSPARKVELA